MWVLFSPRINEPSGEVPRHVISCYRLQSKTWPSLANSTDSFSLSLSVCVCVCVSPCLAGQVTLADKYEYVMHGRVYRFEHQKDTKVQVRKREKRERGEATFYFLPFRGGFLFGILPAPIGSSLFGRSVRLTGIAAL